jgi:hypothetical protein
MEEDKIYLTDEEFLDSLDPNEDLIGFEFNTDDLGPVVVVGTPHWSDGNYVEVRTVDNDEKVVASSCRSAGLVRNRMHAEADAELIGHAQDAKDALDADS